MKYILFLLVVLFLTSCQSTIEPAQPETKAPVIESIQEPEASDTEAIPETPAEAIDPADIAPPISEEDTQIPIEPNPPVEPETYGEVIIPAPSFTEYKWTLDQWGDLVQLDEEGMGFVEEDMVPGSFALVQIDLPDSWELTVTTAQDIPRSKAGMFHNKRMEYYSFLYRTPEHPETAEERVNSAGYTYYFWTEGDPAVSVAQWHHCEFPVAAPMEETYYFHIYFLTFTDNYEAADPADYFDAHIFPVIDDLRVAFSNVGWASLPLDYTIACTEAVAWLTMA